MLQFTAPGSDILPLPTSSRSMHGQVDSLEPFRDGVAELRQNDAVIGHLATQVERFWDSVDAKSGFELRAGFLRWSVDAQELQFKVVWLQGDDARRAWQRCGIHEPVGEYL